MLLESDYSAALLLAAPAAIPELRLFKRQVMLVKVPTAGRGPARSVAVGVKGQSDLYGIVRGTGRHLELELKALRGVLTDDQKSWLSWCTSWGIPAAVLRPQRAETLEQTVARWCAEILVLVRDPLVDVAQIKLAHPISSL